ncbi:MAG: HAD-IIA family hydrolase [Defluviitaleaceae bacterium]|nr:HAD-IIA family hydrolase [Defluviitaleaceae bacterium]MCL2836745.1 HAD-IIA family hydrolase [Defluviitaleaceae bacterium]
MAELNDIDAFLLDMDGTVYLGDRLIDGALDFLAMLKKLGKRYVFLTNNSSKNRYDYVSKLNKLGVQAKPDDIFTSGEAAAVYLSGLYPAGKAYLLGTPSLEKEFTNAGLKLITERDKDPDFVLLGFDTTLTYAKIWAACDYIRGNIPFYATHPDFNCPLEGNKFMPDTGSMIRMFEASTGISPVIIGKPHEPMVSGVLKKYGLKKESTAIVGDRLQTDIMLGITAGITSILVLSGGTSREDYKKSDIRADYVFDNIGAIWEGRHI